MIKRLFFATIGLAIALSISLIMSPVQAADPDPAVYTWDYLNLGSDRLVCKEIALHPQSLPMTKITRSQPIRTYSRIVSDRYCSGLTQPIR